MNGFAVRFWSGGRVLFCSAGLDCRIFCWTRTEQAAALLCARHPRPRQEHLKPARSRPHGSDADVNKVGAVWEAESRGTIFEGFILLAFDMFFETVILFKADVSTCLEWAITLCG